MALMIFYFSFGTKFLIYHNFVLLFIFFFCYRQNWLPVLLEPVPDNYHNLVKTYGEIQTKYSLPCALPLNAAISYDDNSSGECAFCRYNVGKDAPEECSHSDWMKTQIGTLDCDYSKRFFGAKNFEKCIVSIHLSFFFWGGGMSRRHL